MSISRKLKTKTMHFLCYHIKTLLHINSTFKFIVVKFLWPPVTAIESTPETQWQRISGEHSLWRSLESPQETCGSQSSCSSLSTSINLKGTFSEEFGPPQLPSKIFPLVTLQVFLLSWLFREFLLCIYYRSICTHYYVSVVPISLWT